MTKGWHKIIIRRSEPQGIMWETPVEFHRNNQYYIPQLSLKIKKIGMTKYIQGVYVIPYQWFLDNNFNITPSIKKDKIICVKDREGVYVVVDDTLAIQFKMVGLKIPIPIKKTTWVKICNPDGGSIITKWKEEMNDTPSGETVLSRLNLSLSPNSLMLIAS